MVCATCSAFLFLVVLCVLQRVSVFGLIVSICSTFLYLHLFVFCSAFLYLVVLRVFAAHVLSNWWRYFLNLLVLFLFACVFWSCSALSSLGHCTVFSSHALTFQCTGLSTPTQKSQKCQFSHVICLFRPVCKNGIRYGQNENENALPGSRWWLQKSGNTPVHKVQHFHFSHPLVTKKKGSQTLFTCSDFCKYYYIFRLHQI